MRVPDGGRPMRKLDQMTIGKTHPTLQQLKLLLTISILIFGWRNTNKNIIKDELKVKRKNAFRELLKESNVNVTSNWKEIRRKIKDDVRYQKYRHSLPLKLIII